MYLETVGGLDDISMPFHNGIRTPFDNAIKVRDAPSEENGGVQVDLLYCPSHGLFCDLIDNHRLLYCTYDRDKRSRITAIFCAFI
ncbi:MAG TPA: hypothetical protein VIH61_05130 [Waddliaceae bacterium]